MSEDSESPDKENSKPFGAKFFSAFGSHLDSNTREYVAGVGAITVMWAHVELGLDMLIALDGHFNPSPNAKRQPIPFSAKIDRLTEIYIARREPFLSYAGEVAQIITVCESLSKRRHPIIHGAMMTFLNAPEANVIRLVRGLVEDDLKTENISFPKMIVLFQASFEIMAHIFNLGARIFKEKMPDFDERIADLVLTDVSNFRIPPINRNFSNNNEN